MSAAGRSAHCCLCGAPRRPTQAPVESFGNSYDAGHILRMGDHRPLQEGRWETSPQMIVSILMYRNGGSTPGQTHICDECIVVGLKEARRFVEKSLKAMGAE